MKQAENKKRRNKKVVTGTLAICLLAAMAIGGTLAYLTDTEQVTNHFSTGDLDIDIDEDEWDDDGDDDDDDDDDGGDEDDDDHGDGKNLVPGDVRYKNPTVTAHDGDSYMRVIMQIQDKSGELLDGVAPVNFTNTAILTNDTSGLAKYKDESLDNEESLNAVLKLLIKLKNEQSFYGDDAQTAVDTVINKLKGDFEDDPSTCKFTAAQYDSLINAEKDNAADVEKARLELILQTIYYDTEYDPEDDLDSDSGYRTHKINKDWNYYYDDEYEDLPGAHQIPDTVNKPITGDDEIFDDWTNAPAPVVKALAGTNTENFELDKTRSSDGIYVYNYIRDIDTENYGEDDKKNVFKEGTQVTLFTDVIIPAEWNQKQIILLGEYQIVLQAQAVQAANFVDDDTVPASGKYAWEIAYDALDYEIENGTAMQNYDELGKQYDDPFDFAELVDNN